MRGARRSRPRARARTCSSPRARARCSGGKSPPPGRPAPGCGGASLQASGARRCLPTQPPMHARAIPCACTHMGVCACLRAPATACSCTTPPPRAHPHARTQPARMPAQHAHIAYAPPAFTVKIPGRIGPPNAFSHPFACRKHAKWLFTAISSPRLHAHAHTNAQPTHTPHPGGHRGHGERRWGFRRCGWGHVAGCGGLFRA